MRYTNLVFAKHGGDSKRYLFVLPLDSELSEGAAVYVDTMRGTQRATTTCDSFIVPATVARTIALNFGAYLPLKRVVAEVKETCRYFET